MPSFKSAALAVAAALVATVQADYYINPDSVSASLRSTWCANELTTCPLICQQTPPGNTLTNTCDTATLTYGCLCGNGLQPNVSEYSLTLPFFVCQEWGNQCVTACGIYNNQCASDCRQNHPCGALSPTRLNSTTPSTMSATASATNQVYTGLAGGGSSSSQQQQHGNLAPTLDAGGAFGFVVIMGGLVAGVAWML